MQDRTVDVSKLSQLGFGDEKDRSLLERTYREGLTKTEPPNGARANTVTSDVAATSPSTSPRSETRGAASYAPTFQSLLGEAAPRPTHRRIIERWSGVVTEVHDDWFVGRLQPTPGAGDEMVGDFQVDELSEDDRALLNVGSWFYVIVAQERYPDGRRSTVSSVRFQRHPKRRSDDLAFARERAHKLASLLDDDDQ